MRSKLLSLAAALAMLPAGLWAAISVGPGSVVQTFDTTPAVTEWSTLSIAGGSADLDTAAEIDAAVAALAASTVNTALGTSATMPPSANAIARHNTAGLFLQTKPTGNAGLYLMATLQNNSGGPLSTISVSYDLALLGTDTANEVPGHRAYFSLTGAAGSWQPIPEFTTGTAGALGASLNLGSWANGATMYLLWVDQNSANGTDQAFTIDNFFAGLANVPVSITVQPTNQTVTVEQSVTFVVGAQGSPPLFYQWLKGSSPIAGATNATYTIDRAASTDAGTYRVQVSNGFSSQTSADAVLTVIDDTVAPFVVEAVRQPDITTIIVTWSEDMDPNALAKINYTVTKADFSESVETVETVPGTDGFYFTNGQRQIVMATTMPIDPTGEWQIWIQPIMTDLAGNAPTDLNEFGFHQVTLTIPKIVTFQYGVNGYTGTVDTDIEEDTPDSTHGADTTLTFDNSGPHSQGLIRFDNIIGSAIGQVPLASTIKAASLRLYITDPGNNIAMHRMLVTWDGNSSWNSMVGGVSTDDVEATAAVLVTFNPHPDESFITIDVTSSVQAWVNGAVNHGWLFINTATGSDGGFDLASSENATTDRRPLLTVDYEESTEAQPINIVTQPAATVSVNERESFEISVGVSGTNPSFQWYKNNVAIPGATSSSYSVASAVPNDAGTYKCTISNDYPSSQTTIDSVVTVVVDTTNPKLLSATVSSSGSVTLNTILVAFDKAMGASAGVGANYTVALAAGGGNVGISSASLVDSTTVQLNLASSLTVGTQYRVTASTAVKDATFTGNSVIAPDNNALVDQRIVLNTWTQVWKYDGSSNSLDGLGWEAVAYNDTAWSSGPAPIGWETTGTAPGGLAGWPTPIQTEMRSTNWTTYYRTTINNPLTSIPVGATIEVRHLIDDAVQCYVNGTHAFSFNIPAADIYFTNRATSANEAAVLTTNIATTLLHSGNNTIACSLHAGGTTSSDTVFAMEFAIVFSPSALSLEITQQPVASTNVVEGDPLTLSVAVSGVNPVYQWRKGGVDIPGANAATYTIATVRPSDAATYTCFISNSSSSVTSQGAVVTVSPDTTSPTLLSVTARGNSATTLNTVIVTVDETLATAGAQTPGNYTVTRAGGGNVAVNTAVLNNGTSVVLTLASSLVFGSDYTLTLSGVTDTAQAQNPVSPNSMAILQQIVVLNYTNSWKYDQTKTESDNYDAVNWMATGFDDSAWPAGNGILARETTAGTLAIFPAPLNTTLTVSTQTIYFRTTFPWAGGALPARAQFTVNHFVDDGFRCFLNGTEAFRFKMPEGAVTHATLSDDAGLTDEAVEYSTNLQASAVLANNTIACDLHPLNATSSDSVFGLEILAEYPVGAAADVNMTVTRTGNQITIDWDSTTGTLVESDNAAAPLSTWTVSAQQKGVAFTPSGARKFYAVRLP